MWLLSPPLEPGRVDAFVWRSASAAMDDAPRFSALVRTAISSTRSLRRLGISEDMDDDTLTKLVQLRAVQCGPLAVPGTPSGPGLLPGSPAPDRSNCDFTDTETSYAIVLRMTGDAEHLLQIEVRDRKYLNVTLE